VLGVVEGFCVGFKFNEGVDLSLINLGFDLARNEIRNELSTHESLRLILDEVGVANGDLRLGLRFSVGLEETPESVRTRFNEGLSIGFAGLDLWSVEE